MKLIFAYVRSFKNIHEQEFGLSDDYDVSFESNKLSIWRMGMESIKNILYGGNLIKDMHIVIGRTGAGKTNLLQMIGMNFRERWLSQNTDAYFLLYKCNSEEDTFAVEVFNMYIPQIAKILRAQSRNENIPRIGFWKFRYDFDKEQIKDVDTVNTRRRHRTVIVNTFDRHAFAKYPYHDIVEPEQGLWIPRKVTPYAESHPEKIVNAAREYVEQMPKNSIKRKAAFVINRENWQHSINIELPQKLVETEYWLYGERRQDGIVKSLSDIHYASISTRKPLKGKSGEKISVKEMFLHDLMTDYAIYLRKVASTVHIISELLAKYRPIHPLNMVENPTILPDGNTNLSLEKRLSWLGQYIDYHTDEINGNKGLVWHECNDIIDIIGILRQFEDKYFTPDQFSYPITEIDEHFDDLFERMGQYHQDQYEVFPREILPYTLTYLSSGEFQYAKIWGAMEEAIETKLAENFRKGRPNEINDINLIVLMDEPETYLHPEYCRQFIYRTVKVLERRNPGLQLQLIITTHSPFMLSDTISSQVTRIDYDEYGECKVLDLSKKEYFAANLFSIMADGFFLNYTIGEYSRTFLTEKFNFLKKLASKKSNITQEERAQVKKICEVLPYIGDEMIRHCFENIIDLLG